VSEPRDRWRQHARTGRYLLALISLAAAASAANAPAASQSVVVSLTVPSASYLSVDPADVPGGDCRSNVPGRTALGTVQPGTGAVSTLDCSVVFGSSNDTAMLRMYQQDVVGAPMWTPSRGQADTGFQGDGVLEIDIAGGADEARSVLRQPDNRILIAGRANTGANDDLALVRLNADGTPDASFGGGDGKVTTPVGASNDQINEIALQPDGKIVAVGQWYNGSTNEWVIARYESDGDLDPTFNGTGLQTWSPCTVGSDVLDAVAIQPDGRIFVAGNFLCSGRLAANGTVDTSYDGDGYLFGGAGPLGGTSVAILPDGDYLVGGFGYLDAVVQYDWLVTRLNPNGSVDTSWAGDGRSEWNSAVAGGAHDYLYGMAIASDGSVFVSGSGGTGATNDMFVLKYAPNGTLDGTFGSGGVATVFTGPNSQSAADVIVQYDGSVLVAGQSASTAAFARFTAGGQPDTRFDTDGYIDYAVAGNDALFDGVELSDGRYAGVGTDGAGNFLLRVLGTTTVSNFDDDNVGADSNWADGTEMFGACLRSVTSGATTNGTTWTADTADADCADGNVDPWRPIVATGAMAGSKVAESPLGDGDATANLRFGFRAAANQAPGTYVAPVTFEVVAPAA
jgi:uncharacterized delta-60 repeat protein